MSEDELLTGRAGNEVAQGWSQMEVAHSVEPPEEGPLDDAQLAHLSRPEPPEPIRREYMDFHDNEMPERLSVSPEQAASDLERARELDGAVLEEAAKDELRNALDGVDPQAEQPQPETFEPQPEAADPTPNAAWADADQALSKALENPIVRERISGEFNAVNQRAAAAAQAIEQRYTAATSTLVAEASAIITASFPELQGLSGPELKGALAVLAKENPARAAEFQQALNRASNVFAAQQQHRAEMQRGLELKQTYELQQFTEAEEKRFEQATKHESPETMKQVREAVYPVAERYYGVPKQMLQAIYSGQQRVDFAALMRSSAFQLMMVDAIKYRLAQENISRARSNPVKPVMRPGVSEPRGDDSDYASLERAFRGKDLSAKQAADLLIAHRARR